MLYSNVKFSLKILAITFPHLKKRNWSISKAYKYEDQKIEECFEKGMSIIDTFFEVLTGSGSD